MPVEDPHRSNGMGHACGPNRLCRLWGPRATTRALKVALPGSRHTSTAVFRAGSPGARTTQTVLSAVRQPVPAPATMPKIQPLRAGRRPAPARHIVQRHGQSPARLTGDSSQSGRRGGSTRSVSIAWSQRRSATRLRAARNGRCRAATTRRIAHGSTPGAASRSMPSLLVVRSPGSDVAESYAGVALWSGLGTLSGATVPTRP
jgi:hypothetical protein